MSDRLPRERHVRAPELDGGVAWLNVDRPLRLVDLRGQLVILDFWTYCCINCMHVLPVLRELEERHAQDPLVVIGVHSAKFTGEKDPERITDAIARYGIRHPVVVDSEMRIWRAFAIRSWPTLVVVRPDGTIAAVAPGEPDPRVLGAFVKQELDEARRAGTLADGPPALAPSAPLPAAPLSFPGKVLVAPDGRVVVADSGHHRVVVMTPDGTVVAVAGSGLQGSRDGAFAEAAFDDPQGLALAADGRTLYVADARAHQLRVVDLEARTVATLAGTGRLGDRSPRGRVPALDVALRSPWDLALDERRRALYVAMAGTHQLWRLSLDDGLIEVWAGTGAESIEDGPRLEATFSQPSGLALSDDGEVLWVADSESSAVRAVRVDEGTVRTVVGVGLFDFGDVDGPADRARLQHCLGLCPAPEGLVVADTYNHKLRLVDPATGAVRTLWKGHDELALREPGGVARDARDGSLVVADTNHHRVARVRPAVGELLPIVPVGLAPPVWRGVAEGPGPDEPAAEPAPATAAGWFTAILELRDGEGLAPGAAALALELEAPRGQKLATGSPVVVRFEVSRRPDLLRLRLPDGDELRRAAAGGASERLELAVDVAPLPSPIVEAEVIATVDAVVCGDDERLCTPIRSWFRVPVRLLRDGGAAAAFHLPLPAP